MSDRIAIIGPGRMGLALGAALREARAAEHFAFLGRGLEPPPHPIFEPQLPASEWDVLPGVEYRMMPSALPERTTIVLLAVPDHALREVAYELSHFGAAPPGCVALHLSGALSTDVLEPLFPVGYTTGSMHPLQTVADPWHSADRLQGITFGLGGEPAAMAAARRLAAALGSTTLVVPPSLRPVYHAAAVMASNYVVALVAATVRVLEHAGVEEDDALRAILPLVQGALDNIRDLGVPAALMGPIPRGDTDTIRLHLARLSPRERVLYCDLGLELLELARAAGLDDARAGDIEALLASR